MSWQYPAYVLPLLLATATLVMLALYTRRHRSTPGAGTFALLMLAAAWWASMYTLELGSVGLDNKVIWAKAKYLGVVTLPVAWLAFALQYTGRGRWLTKRNLALLSIMPLATLALVATNEAHYLIWEPEIDTVGPFSVLHMGFGAWFWVQAAYSYLLLLLGTLLLLWTIVPALRLYFPQNLVLLMGVLIPWAANALYIFRFSPIEDLDPTPFAFALTGIAIAWGLLRFRLLDVVPVARGAIVERIPAGIVVVDDQERIADLNPAAQRILGRPASSAVGRRTRDLLPDLGTLLEKHRGKKEVREEVSLGNGSGSRDYLLDLSPLPDKNGGPSGRLILLHDITRRKSIEESLRGSEAKFRSVVESIGEALLITDKNDVVTFMNSRVTDLTGYTEEDMLGRPAYELFLSPEEWPVLFRHNQRRTQGISERYEMRLKRRDGELIWVEVNATPYRNADGEIVGTLGAIVDTTERKRSEERLREAEELFRTTFEKTPVGMSLVDLDGHYLRVNEALCEILGYSKEEFLSTNFSEITHPEDREMSLAHARRLSDGEVDSYSLEKRYLHGEGHPVWVSLSVSMVRDSEGNPLHHIAQVQDISQWKSIEETLRESEQRFRQLFDQSVDPLLIHDERGNIVDCNPEACRVHGYPREEMVSLSVKDLTDNLLSEEEKQAREKAGGTLWQRALAGDLDKTSDFHLGEHKRKDGTTFPVEVLVGGLDYAGRRLILASVRDTTERRRIENALRESEERFRALVQYGSDIIAILEADGTIRYESPAVERVLGYRPEETVGTSVFDYLHPDDLEKTASGFFEGIEANKSTGMAELRFRHADGSWRHIEAIGINLLDDPAVEGIVVNSRDITGRKRAEEELRKSEERFRAIFEGSGVGISIADLDRKLLQTNVAYQEMTGYSEDELRGKPIAELSHPDEVPEDKELNERLLSGELDRYQREKRYIRKDGETIWAKPTVSAVRDVEGEPLFLVGVVEDVTERKQTEDALRESEERFRQLFEHSVDLLFVHDEEGRIFECNTEACRALGYTREELRNSMVGDIAARLLTEEERKRKGSPTLWERAMRSEPGKIVGFEQNELCRADGSVFPVEIGVGTIDYGGRRMIFASARDITEHKILEERLTYQAFHDPLTHLPNRVLFLERLQHALSRLSRRRCCIAVLFMDLDNFKVINDSLGHELGDRLLRAVSGRLKTCLRPEDTVARFGGDEFTMLLEDVGDIEEAEAVAGRILRSGAVTLRATTATGVRGHQPGNSPGNLGSGRPGGPGAQRGYGDVRGQKKRQGAIQSVRAGHDRSASGTPGARSRPQAGHRGRRIRRSLPARNFAGNRRGLRFRSAGALGAPEPRDPVSKAVHPARGRERSDPTHRA